MAEKMNNCTAAPRSCGVLWRPGIEDATPRVMRLKERPEHRAKARSGSRSPDRLGRPKGQTVQRHKCCPYEGLINLFLQ
jgi:hypothetical protein